MSLTPAFMYLLFTVGLVGVLYGIAYHYYWGSGKATSEQAKINMMDDDD